MPEESIAALEQRRAHLCQQLASIGEMRSGSLMARCRRCGKTGCGCAPPGKAQRGPVLSLTRKQSGKTVTRIIPARAAEQAWAAAAEYRRFRRLSQELIEASDALSEARHAGAVQPQVHRRRGGGRRLGHGAFVGSDPASQGLGRALDLLGLDPHPGARLRVQPVLDRPRGRVEHPAADA